MIPVEAVEAAVKAFRETKFMDDALMNALEAAAPHIIAVALREAAEAWGEAASWSDSRPSPEQVQRWLKSRANVYTQT